MRTMKKMLAGAVALTMALTMNVVVFAQGETTYQDQESVTFTKRYNAANTGTTSPEETFSFDITKESVTDAGTGITQKNMPEITDATVAYTAGEAGSSTKDEVVTINLPDYTGVGVYTYQISETPGDTAGVTYDGTDVYLVVTVIQQGDDLVRLPKIHVDSASGEKLGEGEEDADKAFVNTYSAGTLNVSKTVKGAFGDRNKDFEFTVTFTKPESENVESDIDATVAGEAVEDFALDFSGDGVDTYTFNLKHDETASFTNIPYGVTYTVTETATEGYDTTKTGDSGTIEAATQTAAFTNTKGGTIDTGISTDSLPYFLIAAGVVAGAAVLVTRRRRFDD